MVGLRLFGAIHTDRHEKVAAEFDRVADGVDAVFLEYPADGFGLSHTGSALLRAPLATLGLLLASLVQWPLYAILVRRPEPAEVVAARSFAADHDLPVHAVDDHPVDLLADAGLSVVVPNWLALLAVGAVQPTGTVVTSLTVVGLWLAGSLLGRVHRAAWAVGALVLSGSFAWAMFQPDLLSSLLLAVAMVALLLTAVTTLSTRNEVMVERVVEISDDEEYESAVLTTGRAHLPGLRTAARDLGVSVEQEYVPKLLRRGTLRVPEERAATERAADPDSADDALLRRVAAGVIDGVGAVGIGGLTGLTAGGVGWVAAGATLATVAGSFGILLGGFCYYAVPEAHYGQTPGKALLGLIVVDTDGYPASRWAVGFRTLLRPLDAVTLFVVPVVGIWDGRQRLGDRAAGTVVARRGAGEDTTGTA